ncbi:hypothetical protein BV911_17875 [Pseudoruegeria sp. SK021]|nr:hypothetical protein BV911_17875 [Pseudoruegeria sp. SK021]
MCPGKGELRFASEFCNKAHDRLENSLAQAVVSGTSDTMARGVYDGMDKADNSDVPGFVAGGAQLEQIATYVRHSANPTVGTNLSIVS